MEWVQPFYTQKSAWLGALGLPLEIRAHDRQRALTVARWSAPAPAAVLELGCGDGSTAAACADLGYHVTGIELSPLRFAQAQSFTHTARNGTLSIIAGDFYQTVFPNRFASICYWDGFGIGTDHDQQQLLRRIAHEWLHQDGTVLIEIFNPLYWSKEAGKQRRFEPIGLTVEYDYNPIQSRFIERCIPDDDVTQVIAQTIRCYAPSDLQLLVQGTGLQVVALDVGGAQQSYQDANDLSTPSNPWWTASEYLAVLTRTV